METQRSKKAKLNISVSLVKQIITLVCGLIVPRVMLRAFGSEANGAVSSIAQFLAYITLLEGGIGGVARAALYKPLAAEDRKVIGSIMFEIQHFFRLIGYLFAAYVIVLACSFSTISRIEYSNPRCSHQYFDFWPVLHWYFLFYLDTGLAAELHHGWTGRDHDDSKHPGHPATCSLRMQLDCREACKQYCFYS